MGDVVVRMRDYEPRRRAVTSPVSPRLGLAEIVILPVVRIERPAPTPPAKPKRKA